MNRLLRTEEVAELLSLKKNTLEIWRHEGKGPAFVRINGRSIRYRAEDVQAYLNGSVAKNTCRTIAA